MSDERSLITAHGRAFVTRHIDNYYLDPFGSRVWIGGFN